MANTVKGTKDANGILEGDHELGPLPRNKDEVPHLYDNIKGLDASEGAGVALSLTVHVILESESKTKDESE